MLLVHWISLFIRGLGKIDLVPWTITPTNNGLIRPSTPTFNGNIKVNTDYSNDDPFEQDRQKLLGDRQKLQRDFEIVGQDLDSVLKLAIEQEKQLKKSQNE